MTNLYNQQEVKQYKKSGDWNKFIYIDAILNSKSNKFIHKKIKQDAHFYQKIANMINKKFLNQLILDEVSAESLGLNSKKYQVVYTNFIGHYILEIRRLSDKMIINFKQASPAHLFFFNYTNGNRSDISLLKRSMKL